jgi:hypothetical protein
MTAYLDVKQEFLGYRQYSRLIVRGVRNAHPVLLGKMNKVVIQIWSSHLYNCSLKHAIEIRRPDPSRVIAVAGEAYLTVFISEQKSAEGGAAGHICSKCKKCAHTHHNNINMSRECE